MIKRLVTAVFGTHYDREMKKIQPLVDAIKREEERLKAEPEEVIRGQTAQFRARLAERLGAVQGELDAVRQAKHDCEDPARAGPPRDAVPRARGQLQEGARRGARRPAARGVRHGAGGLPPPARHHGHGHRARARPGTWCPTTCS